jgi:orotate phosphoribosyltransferase
MPDIRRAVVQLVLDKGYVRRAEPFRLSSGEMSRDYVDAKKAIAAGRDLRLAAQAVLDLAAEEGVEFDAVGGLTMGADPLAHAIALLADKKWFAVRKEAKSHGKQRSIEGAELSAGEAVLLVDDVITTGSSSLKALDAIEALGARVVLATCIVDRGKLATDAFSERGVRFRPLATYEDLGIDPIGG